MAQEQPQEAIRRYLADAIAAERNFENQLRTFVDDTDQQPVKQLFRQHADETRGQIDRLESRLRDLGGEPSGFKSFMANLFGAMPRLGQVGHHEAEKGAQDLIAAFAVENSEVAMYEAMAAAASAAGDAQTERLARDIQQQERRTAEMVWGHIASSSRDAFQRVTGVGMRM